MTRSPTASRHLADLVAAGHEVVVTHGNGPQVGNLLVKNELAAHVVPPVPLDWCGAQTQGTIGFTLLDTLEAALAARGVERPVAAIITRTLVDADDPGFTHPTKPIGRFLPREQAQTLIDHGERWEDRGEKGWRRVVASPEPVEVLETHTLHTLLAAGYVVVTAGGGGIPVVRGADGSVHGVEAVIDKDLTAALLARAVDADVLVIATDVAHAVAGWGTPERPRHRPGHARADGGVCRRGPLRVGLDGPEGRGRPALRPLRRLVDRSSRPSTSSPPPSTAMSEPSSKTLKEKGDSRARSH